MRHRCVRMCLGHLRVYVSAPIVNTVKQFYSYRRAAAAENPFLTIFWLTGATLAPVQREWEGGGMQLYPRITSSGNKLNWTFRTFAIAMFYSSSFHWLTVILSKLSQSSLNGIGVRRRRRRRRVSPSDGDCSFSFAHFLRMFKNILGHIPVAEHTHSSRIKSRPSNDHQDMRIHSGDPGQAGKEWVGSQIVGT